MDNKLLLTTIRGIDMYKQFLTYCIIFQINCKKLPYVCTNMNLSVVAMNYFTQLYIIIIYLNKKFNRL